MKVSIFGTMFIIFLFAINNISAQTLRKGSAQFKVVINHEEQYSILPLDSKTMKGWQETGKKGSMSACMAYIEEVWTDMRPLSIRKMKLPDHTNYRVVINHEEQFMVYPVEHKPPKGWKNLEVTGSLKECMDYIEEVWTDMRPLSFR